MNKVYWLTCPECYFKYYVGRELLEIKSFPTVCPKCHHEYLPEQSATKIEGVK